MNANRSVAMLVKRLRCSKVGLVGSVLIVLSGLPGSGASAAPVTFFGEDLGEHLPPASAAKMPNSFGARDDFLSHLSGFGVEDFENIAVGTNAPPLIFDGAGVTGTITGERVTDAANDSATGGRFPISGDNYLRDNGVTQRIDLDTPVAAFGLFAFDF